MRLMRMGVLIICLICIIGGSVYSEDQGNFSITPTKNQGKKWRIGYYEGGEYIEYQKTLIAVVKGLYSLGWIASDQIPEQKGEQTKELWTWLANSLQSDFIEFVKDAHYSANWDDALRPTVTAGIVNRFSTAKDIDLIIAMGTWAGQDLANGQHSTPVIAMAVSDAVASNIVSSAGDSGRDHVHARVDPTRYERQVSIFHEIIGFQKLGIAYEDTVDGRSYAALNSVEKMGEALGFEIVRCYTKNLGDVEQEEQLIASCFHELGKNADAIYVTPYTGITTRSISQLVDIANSYKIPTFSQAGSEEVKNGFLLSISQAGFKYVGDFEATVIAKVLNGAKPRQIDQMFEDPPKIAINLKTAELIGYDPSIEVLGAADEIYQEISTPSSE